MIRDGKIHIPISLFSFPFIALFRLLRFSALSVRFILTLVLLATGVGALVAGLTGGFGRKYTILAYGKTGDFGCIKVEERPGFVKRFLGVKVCQNEYFAKYPEDDFHSHPYYTQDQQAISNGKRARIQRVLQGFKVMQQFVR